MTSTRKPRDRLLSLFLQTHHTRSQKLGSDLPLLEQFLTSLNPWALYNYHTGENRKGSCPITEEDKILLRDAVNQYDIVIDADLKEHSNEILKANDLFLLSDDSSNRRGAKDLVLTSELKELLKEKTCVEDELHLLFRLRMASSYENVTGTPCLQRTRQPKTTCF